MLGLPILLTEKCTYEATVAIERLLSAPHALANNDVCAAEGSRAGKLEAAEQLMEAHVDKKFVAALGQVRLTEIDSDCFCLLLIAKKFVAALGQYNPPRDVSDVVLKHFMFSAARRAKQHIVLPEGNDIRVVTAAAELLHRGLCDLTLLGNAQAVRALAERAHVCC